MGDHGSAMEVAEGGDGFWMPYCQREVGRGLLADVVKSDEEIRNCRRINHKKQEKNWAQKETQVCQSWQSIRVNEWFW